MSRPALLLYCQHSLGLGHLARSLTLAGALAARFEVVIANGGRLPAGTRVPLGVRVVNLPPLGHDEANRLISHDPHLDVAAAQLERVRLLLDLLAELDPAVLVVELYPFGRKKFEFELLPLLDAARARPRRPTVVCSLRDILVSSRTEQARHDERACRRANEYIDAVLVHSDPAFARLDESFAPATPLRPPVHYTGFVAPPAAEGAVGTRVPRLLVSAGGGMVGEPLFRAAVALHERLHAETGLTTTVVAGPFLPAAAWHWLQEEGRRHPALDVVRRVDDLSLEMRRSAVSLSQGGYNTTMDLLRAQVPAVVVPYCEGTEDEQTRRTARLAALGALRMVHPADLTGDTLLRELCDAAATATSPPDLLLDLDGADASARIVAELAGLPELAELTVLVPA
jgi:predicted glycosyltransferase